MSAANVSAALAADAAWSVELRRVFGKNAGQARYDARGTSTPELRRLCDAKFAAEELPRCAHGTPLRDWGGNLLFPRCACRIDQPYDRSCPRCKSPATRPCSSVGQDSYARGRPLLRPHPERLKVST